MATTKGGKIKGLKSIGEVIKERPSKLPARAVRAEKEESAHDEGQPIQRPKLKKTSIAVAIRHKAVLDTLANNLRKPKQKGDKRNSMYNAMIAQGFSPSYARSCTQMTETKDFQKLMEKYLPDNLLATTHGDLMIASKLEYMLFTSEVKDEDIYALLESKGMIPKKIVHGIQGTHVWFFLPDNKIRKDATELGYKVKGKMAPEVIEFKDGIRSLSDADLAALIKRQTDKLRKRD